MEERVIKGNKGEWSEIYAFLRLLADGKVHAADEDLNILKSTYFPIIKIIREETKGQVREYYTGDAISVVFNGTEIANIDSKTFDFEADRLYRELVSTDSKGTFAISRTQSFMHAIQCYKISAPSLNKADITMQLSDINTGYKPTVGFSIKSDLGALPTLLNAGRTTNFAYKITDSSTLLLEEINSIYKYSGTMPHTDVRGRIANIYKDGATLKFHHAVNPVFRSNLEMIDSYMDRILAQALLHFYRDGISKCVELVEKMEDENPFAYGNIHAYRYKFKKFLTSVALGMRPASIWDGVDEASGGYLIVKKDGNVVAYHLYNRNYFEDYLLNNTKFETASTSRHDFGEVYEVDGLYYLNLNLQIRFV